MECIRLRVKDVEMEKNQLLVRDGKGMKDRVMVLPASVKADLAGHLQRVKLRYEQDGKEGAHVMQQPGIGVRSPLDM